MLMQCPWGPCKWVSDPLERASLRWLCGCLIHMQGTESGSPFQGVTYYVPFCTIFPTACYQVFTVCQACCRNRQQFCLFFLKAHCWVGTKHKFGSWVSWVMISFLFLSPVLFCPLSNDITDIFFCINTILYLTLFLCYDKVLWQKKLKKERVYFNLEFTAQSLWWSSQGNRSGKPQEWEVPRVTVCCCAAFSLSVVQDPAGEYAAFKGWVFPSPHDQQDNRPQLSSCLPANTRFLSNWQLLPPIPPFWLLLL